MPTFPFFSGPITMDDCGIRFKYNIQKLYILRHKAEGTIKLSKPQNASTIKGGTTLVSGAKLSARRLEVAATATKSACAD
jgi:hypothetical protein